VRRLLNFNVLINYYCVENRLNSGKKRLGKMPSLSSKPQAAQQNITVDLLQEPVKSSVSVADKKLRNLEKRRLKLVDLQKKS